MMQAYHGLQSPDGLTMAMGHVGMASMSALMEQQSHTGPNLSPQNTVPPLSQQQHQQQPQQQQGQQQAMPVHMNAYILQQQQQQQQHSSNQNNTNQHVSLNSNSTYTHSPIEMNHSPTHMHPPPTPTGSNRASIVSNGHEEAVAAAAAASVAHNHPTGPPNLHRSATHPGVGAWSAPSPTQIRMSQQGHPMSMHQHHQAQMAQMQMRHPQAVPHPSYPGHYPGQQQHHPQHPQQQLQPGPPPPYTRGFQPLRALDAYLLARAIQNAAPHNEVSQIILFAQVSMLGLFLPSR